MRCPSSPGHGTSSSPGRSFWNFTQWTIRPLLLVAGFGGGCGGLHCAMAGLYHSKLGFDREAQARVRIPQRIVDVRSRIAVREDEAEVARAFRQRQEQLIDFCSHHHIVDACDVTSV